MFALLDSLAAPEWRDGGEPDDPERFIRPEDLDPSDPAVTDEMLYGPVESWPGFPDASGDPFRFADVPPGADLAHRCASALAAADDLPDGGLLDLVEAAERVSRWADGVRTRAIARYADRHPAGTSAAPPGGSVASPVTRWVPDELGMTLHVSRLEAQSMIASAQRLAHVLPDTLDALQAGRIDERRADTISYATRTLPDEKARTVEATVLAKADGATHRQVYDRTRRAVHRVDPDGERRRHQVARTERRVTMQPREEGMASLWAFGPAEQCEATFTMLTRLARSLGPGDPRTLDQRRFDLLGQLVQGRITVTDLADLEALLAFARQVSDVDATGTGSDTETDPADGGDDGSAGSVEGDAGSDDAGDDDVGDGDAVDGPGAAGGSADLDPEASEPGLERWPGSTPIEGTARARDDTGQGPVPDQELVAIAVAALARQPRAADIVRKPLVQVVVGIDTLLGSDRPGELIGHGPIPATTARALAAGGTLARMVVDPLSGTLLDYGRTTYAPPVGLADFVRARDQVCRGPGCTRVVRDLDHHQRWDRDGHTSDVNLNGYCASCHVLKELDDWHALPHADGRLTWVSPAGRVHATDPYDYRPFVEDLPAVGEPRLNHVDESADEPSDAPPF